MAAESAPTGAGTSAPYAEVVVNRPILQRQRLETERGDGPLKWTEQEQTRSKSFDYLIPLPLRGQIQAGHLVAVPFRNQQLQGLVVALRHNSEVDPQKLRPLTDLLDPEPLLNPTQLELAQWISRTYLAPLASVINHFLPPGGNRKPKTVVESLPQANPPNNLTPLERALQLYLEQQNKPVPLDDLEASTVEQLIDKGLARKRSILSRPKVRPKMERTVALKIEPDEIPAALLSLGRPSKQAEIMRFLAEGDDPLPTVEETLNAANCATDSPLEALRERDWVTVYPARSLVTLAPAPPSQADPSTLSEAQQAALKHLQAEGRPLAVDELAVPEADLTALIEADYLREMTEPARVSLVLPRENLVEAVIELRRTEKHAAVLSLLAEEDGPVWVGWVYAQSAASLSILKTLAEADLVTLDQERRWRDPLADKTFTLDSPPPLTEAQQEVLNTITPHLSQKPPQNLRPFLLHGVTGSGKTEIYLRAIEKVLKQKQGVIFLVPEVMLATQIVQRVRARFPKKVALWHSSLSPGERYDTWERIRQGELPIVVGPRSALFAPVPNLGLILVDEEHEPAYKQQNRPLYHARDVATQFGKLRQIPVLLGSATPDVVSYRKAQRGEYHLLSLPNRILAHRKHVAVQTAAAKGKSRRSRRPRPPASADVVSLPLPPVEVVDLREELKAGNRSIFSYALQNAIEDTLKAGEQVILFLNRRGTATFVNCRDCGYVADCPQCDNTLTFHDSTRRLVCHYCGYHTHSPQECPDCGSQRIRYFGLGTARVEETLRQMFPTAKPLRFDRDTTRQTGSHFALLQNFMSGQANVMVGTQMVAKGLDLPLVTLVGVISADTALYLPDFRAAERTFQLLMQVAGRAGRSPLGGRVIIQTYTPDQPAIIAASKHDYATFYQDELHFRYEQGYPPFKRLAVLHYSDYGFEKSRSAAQTVAEQLRLWVEQQGFPGVNVIGPAPAYVPRIKTQYRWQILVRAPDPAAVLRPVPLPLGWKVDIDPSSLL